MVSTISSAPPESARSLPNIAPSAIRVPTPAAVLPKPLVKLSTASVIGTPATAATASEPTVRPRKGWTLNLVISRMISAMPIRAAGTRRPAGMAGASAAARADGASASRDEVMSEGSRDVGPRGGARDRGVGVGVGKQVAVDDLLDRRVEVQPQPGLVGLQRLERGQL